MDDLPQTQTQEDIEDFVGIGTSEEVIPWGRLCAYLTTLTSVDLFDCSYTFGRAPGCNIIVDKLQFPDILNVSKQHFHITKDSDNVVYITDLSKNGTYINKVKIGKDQRHIIYQGDVIAVGHPRATIYSFTCNINYEGCNYPIEMRREYFISKKIGRGAFGEVRLAYNKRTFVKYAIKKINKGSSSCANVGYCSPPKKIKTEIEILRKISHPFIIQMKEVFETDNEVFLVLEYMPGGELTRRILSATPFPEDEVKFVFYQILLAIRHLHMKEVTHRDIKPENILLMSDGPYPRIKVTDFGLSKIIDEGSVMETVCGTVNYVAPEVLGYYEPYSRKVDVWSLGVLLFYMLSKMQPFTGTDRDAVARKIIKGNISWDNKVWKNISKPAQDLTKKMLTMDPKRRISLVEIFQHHWIEKDCGMKDRVGHLAMQSFDETDSSEETICLPKRPRLTTSDDDSL